MPDYPHMDLTPTIKRGIESEDRNFISHGHAWAIKGTVKIASTAVDAGNTPTTTLRKGLVLGQLTAGGEYAEYDNGQTDGREVAKAILDESVKTIDADGNAITPNAVVVFDSAVMVNQDRLIGFDVAAKADFANFKFAEDH